MSTRLSFSPFAHDLHKRGMFYSIVEGSTFNIWVSALSGNFLTGMALHLGAGGFALGVLAALPSFSTMLQFVSAPFVVGLTWRRNFLALFSALQRFTGALAGLVALALMPSPWALPVFVAMHLLAWAFMAPPTVVWQGYMTDLVPGEVRGRYFAARGALSGVVSMLVVLLYGRMLDHWPGAPGFRLLYWAAFLGAALNLGAWFLLPELPPGEVRSARSFWATIRVPLHRPGPHRTATLFFAAWAFAQGMAAPFYPVVLVGQLGLSYSSVAVLATIAAITSIATAPVWGSLQDRLGQPKVMTLLAGLLTVVPLLFLVARPGGWPVLVLAHIIQGTASNGMNLANQTLNMRLAPAEDRGSYFAFFAAAGGLTGFVTPMLMGPLTSHFMPGLLVASAVGSGLLCLLWQTKLSRLVATAA
jgi:MFS family permease